MGAVEICYHAEVRDTAPLTDKISAEGLLCPAILKVAAKWELAEAKKKEKQARRSKEARKQEAREQEAIRARVAAEHAQRQRQRQAEQAAENKRQRRAQIEQQAAAIERQRQAQQAAAIEQQRRLADAIAETKRAFESERERQRGWEIMQYGLGMIDPPRTTTKCQWNAIMQTMTCN